MKKMNVKTMKTMKKMSAAAVAALTLTVGSAAAFAATPYATPADAVAGLTGGNVQSVIDERVKTGKTYGTMASEAGVLNEFKSAVFEMKEDRVQELVAEGSITQAAADKILKNIKERQAVCDGTGNGGAGLGLGLGNGNGVGNGSGSGIGSGNGIGKGNGIGNGTGNGGGRGMGNGLRDGSCLNR